MRANNKNIFIDVNSEGGDYITNGIFNTTNGDVTLTRLSGGTVSYNLDGRYSLTGHTHPITDNQILVGTGSGFEGTSKLTFDSSASEFNIGGDGSNSDSGYIQVNGNTYIEMSDGANIVYIYGDLFSNSFVKYGGTSNEFLKADGSVDSNVYLTDSTLPSNIAYVNSGNTFTVSQNFTGFKNPTGVVEIASTSGQIFVGTTAAGASNLNQLLEINVATASAQGLGIFAPISTSSLTGRVMQFGVLGESFARNMIYSSGVIGWGSGSSTRDIFMGRSATGTLRIGNQYNTTGPANLIVNNNITAAAHITSGGTSNQFVKGDGSLDSNIYISSGSTGVTINGNFYTDNIIADPNLLDTSDTNGEIIYFGGGTTVAGNLYYLNTSSQWSQANASAASSSARMLAIALGTSPTTHGMLIRGFARFTSNTNYTNMASVGLPLYMSTTAGAFSQSAPSSTGNIVRIIGFVVSTTSDIMYFNPDNVWVEIA